MSTLVKNFFIVAVAVTIVISAFVRFSMKQCTTYLEDNQHILQPLTNDTGKIIIITGANSGLGYYTALSLAERNSHVLLACRSLQKCDAAKNDILQTYTNASVSTMTLDLSSFQSIRTFAENVKAVHSHVDVLINNAGIMAVNPREVTADGLEAQIGVNHFGHFLLTCLLFPLLAKNGRIINHSSGAHNFHASTFPYSNLQSEENYEPWTAYGNSKVANLLFTFELNRKLIRARNSKGIKSIAVHPGYTATNLQQGKYPFWDVANSWIGMKGEDGALSQIIAAVGTNVEASMNTYIGPKYIMFGIPEPTATGAVSTSEDAAAYLWKESVRITEHDIEELLLV